MFEIAIVGVGCRFPGGTDGPEEFWDFLLAKGDGITDVPAERWSLERFYDPDPDAPGRMYTRSGGFLTRSLYDFDPEYFGISPREAAIMDPQQRLILEVAVEALDDAGLAPRVGGRDVGVYVGGFTSDNQVARHSKQTRAAINSHTATSGTFTMLSNRLSFVLDLHGPSMTIDTACSSSLVALHEAAQAVARGECEVALAGGVNAMLQPETFVSMCKGRFLAPDGHCKTFDAAADGYARGEGAGVVVLKPLAAARADGDRVYAVLRATGANQDGRTSGITVPNPVAQAALARRVLAQSGLAAAEIGYVEAHGTGTAIGDPLELAALGEVYGAVPDRHTPLLVGSVKNSIGHLEAAAGVASVIKTALTLQHSAVAPQAFLHELNPAIPFAAHRIEIPLQPRDFPTGYARPAAAVNGFGYGGTNAHAVLVAAEPEPERPVAALTDVQRVFPVSGRTDAAVRAAAAALADRIDGRDRAAVERLQAAAWGRRLHHPRRLALGWDDPAGLVAQLREVATGEGRAPARAVTEDAAPVFVFSGMGPQWWAMARELLDRPGPFADTAAAIDAAFVPIAGWSIVAALRAAEAESRVTRTEVAQPANFLVQVGLVAELAALGITPAAVLGHSVGEVSAAYVSGALDLHDALLVSCHRARLQATTAGTGGMLAVGLPEADALDWIAGSADVGVAAVNSPSSVTLAGDTAALGALAERLTAAGIFTRALRVEVPYHSHLMDPILEQIHVALAAITPRVPQLPLFSSVTAAPVTGADWGAAYWVDNVRQPVRFAAAVEALLDAGHRVFTEVGPHPVLSGNLRELLVRAGETGAVIATLSRSGADVERLRQTVAELYAAGALRTDRTPGAPAGPVPWADLPRYPWQRSRLWTEVDYNTADRVGSADALPLLGERTESRAPAWEVDLAVAALPWLPDHVVDDLVLVPGAAYVDAALSAAAQLTGGSGQALADLRFVAPLILDEHAVPVLRLSTEPGTRRFTIDSRPATETTWTTHATGRIVDGAFTASTHDLAPTGETVHVEGTELYAALAGRGLRYGPAFQGVQEAWVGTDRLVARVDAAAQSAGRHLAHPATTDAALQCLAALVAAGSDAPTGPVVPYAMGSVRRYGPLPAEVTVAVRRLPRPGLHADLALAGPDGTVALEMLGVEFRPVRPETSVLGALERLWYEVDWERLGTPTAAPTTAADAAAGSLLVLGLGPEPTAVARELLIRDPRTRLVQLPADADAALAPAARLEVADAVLTALDAGPLTVVVAAGAGTPVDLAAGLIGAAAGVQDALDAWLLDAGDRPVPAVRGAVITEQAFGLPDDLGTVDLGHAALVGVRRTLRNEQPDLIWRHVDGEPGTPTAALIGEVLRGGDLAAEADEVALRGGLRLVAVLHRNFAERLAAREVAAPLTDPQANFGVEAPASMLLGDLGLREVPRVPPGPRAIEVRTTTVGLNYKDPAKVIGLLTATELAGTFFGTGLGMESVGVVERVGTEVTEYAVGDRVGMGARNCMVRFLTIDLDDEAAGIVDRAPSTWTDHDGATNLPFLTAHHGLIGCAHVTAADVVLVHGAAGGVGMAGVQVAKSLGATVIATAGSPERRAAARAMGADHVLDSRSLNFVAEVRALTSGRGADVVLSSAPGEVIAANLAAAAEFGRIVEVGKSDIYTGGVLGLAEFDRNLSFHAIDIDRLFAFRRPAMDRLVADVKAAFEAGRYRSLPVTLYPPSQVQAAMEAVARGSHIGRVALDFTEPEPPVRPPLPSAGIRSDAAYLITGGFGTFGLATAAWLAAAGARHLVLVGRSGATTDAAKGLVEDLARAGVSVQQEAMDITVGDLVHDLVARVQAGPAPLAGVFHAAGVLADQPFTAIDAGSLRRVLGPKVDGARLLHEATRDLPLDHFVLYSSATAIVGAVPQSSYSAANSTLDSLVRLRRAEGRPGLSVNWGMLSGEGMAGSSAEVQRHLASIGMAPIDLAGAARMIGEVLATGSPHVGVIDVDWRRWGATHPMSARMPRVAEHVAAAGSAGTEAARLQAELLALEPAQRIEVVGYMLAEQLAVVLGIPAESIDLETALPDLGLDSLMAVELQARVNLSLGVEVSALEFSRGGGLAALAERILPSMVGAEAVSSG